jgi:5-methylcytosine-specific restriction endonuclease McrBC GTP-binding regulatory subunit McrB
MKVPRQLILFGSPGTGKSYHIVNSILPEIDIRGDNSPEDSPNVTRVVFHPEYSYGDFMGKLMPLTKDGQVEYKFYAGHFMQALARAYQNILEADSIEEAQNVALVIEEINRGNSAAIFGTAFQLLDRNDEDLGHGWSEYPVQFSEVEYDRLKETLGVVSRTEGDSLIGYKYKGREYSLDEFHEALKISPARKVRIPPNLYLIATMNTSNESIYHMDVAFKRRWHWQYMDIEEGLVSEEGIAFEGRNEWETFVDRLNQFIRQHHKYVRRVEDKQIGHWFLQGTGEDTETFRKSEVQNKVMFFLWDSVFASSKKPLATSLLGVEESKLVTFGSFAKRVDAFIDAVQNRSWIS